MAHTCLKGNVRLPALGIVFLIALSSGVKGRAQPFPQQQFPLVSPYCGTLLSWFRVMNRNPAALAHFRNTIAGQRRAFFAVQPSRFGLSALNRLTAGILLPALLEGLPMSIIVHGTGGAKFTDLQTALSVGYAGLPSFFIGGRLAVRYQRFGSLRTWLDGSWSTAVLFVIDTIWSLAATVQNFPHFHRAPASMAMYEATTSLRWHQPEASMEVGLLLRSFAAPSAYGLFETAAIGVPFRIGYQLFPATAEFSIAVPAGSAIAEMVVSYQPILGIVVEVAVEYVWAQ